MSRTPVAADLLEGDHSCGLLVVATFYLHRPNYRTLFSRLAVWGACREQPR
jgi:hypothetical protein